MMEVVSSGNYDRNAYLMCEEKTAEKSLSFAFPTLEPWENYNKQVQCDPAKYLTV